MTSGMRPWDSLLTGWPTTTSGPGLGKVLWHEESLLLLHASADKGRLLVRAYLVNRIPALKTRECFSASWGPGERHWSQDVGGGLTLFRSPEGAVAQAESCALEAHPGLPGGLIAGDPDVRDCLLNPTPLLLLLEVMES